MNHCLAVSLDGCEGKVTLLAEQSCGWMWNENEEGKLSYWKCGPQCIWISKKLPSSFTLNCRRPWDHHACHRLSSTAALALRSTADKATWQLGMANAIWWGLVLHCAFETKTFLLSVSPFCGPMSYSSHRSIHFLTSRLLWSSAAA